MGYQNKKKTQLQRKSSKETSSISLTAELTNNNETHKDYITSHYIVC